jgi:excisionase family DNA binding protein
MTILEKTKQTMPPLMSQKDINMARVAQRFIMESLDHSKAAEIKLTTDTNDHPSIALPPTALRFIGQLLGAMSEGKPITLMPSKREFSTVEAANFINVSRPFVIKEIEAGRLKFRMVGTHRRIAFEDLVEYMERMQKGQQAALDKLADNARDLGLEY